MKITALAGWMGSKRTLAPRIVELLGPHRAFVEPFCGSMAVLLAKPQTSFELVNDLHGDLTNLAWVLRHDRFGPWLYRRLRRNLYSEEEFASAKTRLDLFPVAPAPGALHNDHAERAYCYFVLCWMGRSGILGTAQGNTTFTVQYNANGGNQAGRFAAAVDSIPAWRRRLRSVTILRRDGLVLLDRLADLPGQAVYCDPPYFVKTARYEHDFAAGDHQRLATILNRFVKTRVVVSYYDAPELDTLYPYWAKIDCSRAKHLSFQGRRGSTSEVSPEVLLVNQPVTLTEGDPS
ncbi:MAG TPA: DNA adenine methylase [Gemmataceae bacterium]|nr:DNA adenine methylase [Gemmataceae bacterium]